MGIGKPPSPTVWRGVSLPIREAMARPVSMTFQWTIRFTDR